MSLSLTAALLGGFWDAGECRDGLGAWDTTDSGVGVFPTTKDDVPCCCPLPGNVDVCAARREPRREPRVGPSLRFVDE